MDAKALFLQAVEQANNCIRCVRPEHLMNATPCSEWNLKALLHHMVYELLWVPDMVSGKTISEVGDTYEGDVLGEDIQTGWQDAASKAQKASAAADMNATAHLSYADVPVSRYLDEIGGDIFIHTWDVAQALQATLILVPEIAQTVYDKMLPRKQELMDSGLYGIPSDAPDSADTQTKLLALFGRKAMYT